MTVSGIGGMVELGGGGVGGTILSGQVCDGVGAGEPVYNLVREKVEEKR